ncbi:MAG: hypothetical protein AAGA20_11620 [Planctomycetota bacterium]
MVEGERGTHTEARVEREDGRFVVYLDVFMTDASGAPTRVATKRIADYSSASKADVAATWMLRAARRQASDPTGL